MVLYPIVASTLHLGTYETSLFLGGTIHDVAQVVGAGYSVSTETGDLATLTKLVRVSFLVPVVLMFVLLLKRKQSKAQRGKAILLPWFLVAFMLLMLLNSLVNIPEVVTKQASEVSRFALIMAIAGIGMKSNLRQLLDVGLKPILILVAETLWIAGIFIIYLRMF
jgi:uncharacterized integral membrane protein (TIGR00698 family)